MYSISLRQSVAPGCFFFCPHREAALDFGSAAGAGGDGCYTPFLVPVLTTKEIKGICDLCVTAWVICIIHSWYLRLLFTASWCIFTMSCLISKRSLSFVIKALLEYTWILSSYISTHRHPVFPCRSTWASIPSNSLSRTPNSMILPAKVCFICCCSFRTQRLGAVFFLRRRWFCFALSCSLRRLVRRCMPSVPRQDPDRCESAFLVVRFLPERFVLDP